MGNERKGMNRDGGRERIGQECRQREEKVRRKIGKRMKRKIREGGKERDE